MTDAQATLIQSWQQYTKGRQLVVVKRRIISEVSFIEDSFDDRWVGPCLPKEPDALYETTVVETRPCTEADVLSILGK